LAALQCAAPDVDALIADPRHYGFHATLKAPFELADGLTEADLIAALDVFAATRPAFAADLVVTSLSSFVALTLAHPCLAMTELHEACVRSFEPFRAALSEADLARRRRAPLSATQDARLFAFGYPWIFEDFRFHLTLTGRIVDAVHRAQIVAALAEYLAPVTGVHKVSNLCLFHQPERAAPFRVIASSVLSAQA
jgi:2'-5' RNA ligase